jgi:hypothetical protein
LDGCGWWSREDLLKRHLLSLKAAPPGGDGRAGHYAMEEADVVYLQQAARGAPTYPEGLPVGGEAAVHGEQLLHGGSLAITLPDTTTAL